MITNDIEKATKRALKWKENPKLWLLDCFDTNIIELARGMSIELKTETGLSIQQENAFEELVKLIVPRLKKSVGLKLNKEEKEYLNKIGISIQSGTGVGKDFFAALVAWYFLTVFVEVRVVCTANTEKQLKNVLWNELKKVAKLSRLIDGIPLFEREFNIQSEKIEAKDKRLPNFAEAVTINIKSDPKDQAEALKGRHAKHMVFIIDEASGIKEGIKNAIEGTLTGLVNLIVCIFNPTRSTGYAIETQKDNRYVGLRWNAEESEIVINKANHTQLLEKYGRDSNPYRINVLGLPPLSDSDILIPWDWIEDAKIREIEVGEDDVVIKAIDIGAGGDPSVIGTRKGYKVLPFKSNTTRDSNKLTDWAIDNFNDDEAEGIGGDVIGIGWAVMGNLKKALGWKCRSIDSRNRADREDLYVNKRAEMFMNLRGLFENKLLSIPDDFELCNELGVLKTFERETDRKIGIIKKEKIRAELQGQSPNKADALAMLFEVKDEMFRKNKRNNERYRGKSDDMFETNLEDAWMAA